MQDKFVYSKEDLLSVIIPVYNVEKYLGQCLDSIINQTWRNLEIIIIDDGSTDGCGAIIDQYAEKDSRIIVIHKPNEGLCAARNDGIERAGGEWIAFVDSDDWCELDYYEKLISALGNQDVDLMCSGGCMVEHSDKCVVKQGFRNTVLYDKTEDMTMLMAKSLVPAAGNPEKETYYRHNNAAPWDKLYKRLFIEKHHLRFDRSSKAWEDIWFNFQAFDKATRVGGCGYIGYHYRVVSTSITKGFNPKKSRINYEFVEKLYAYTKKNRPEKIIQDALEAYCFSMMSNALQCCYFHPSNSKPFREVAKEIKEMKILPYYQNAIHDQGGLFLSRKQMLLKTLLRLPCIWPLCIVVNGRRWYTQLPVRIFGEGGVVSDHWAVSGRNAGCVACA